MAFDHQSDWDEVSKYYNRSEEVYFIEIMASQKVRLNRNNTVNRLNSFDGEIPYENYLKINNENLSAKEVALVIKNKFYL